MKKNEQGMMATVADILTQRAQNDSLKGTALLTLAAQVRRGETSLYLVNGLLMGFDHNPIPKIDEYFRRQAACA